MLKIDILWIYKVFFQQFLVYASGKFLQTM